MDSVDINKTPAWSRALSITEVLENLYTKIKSSPRQRYGADVELYALEVYLNFPDFSNQELKLNALLYVMCVWDGRCYIGNEVLI